MSRVIINETALSYIDFMNDLDSLIDLLQSKCQKKWFVNPDTRAALKTLRKQRKQIAQVVGPMDQIKRDFLKMSKSLKQTLIDVELWKLNDTIMDLQELNTVSLSPASLTLFVNRPLIKNLNLKLANFKAKVGRLQQEELLSRIAF